MHAFQVAGNSIDYQFNVDLIADAGGLATRHGPAAMASGPLIYRAFPLALGYLLMASVFFAFGVYATRHPQRDAVRH